MKKFLFTILTIILCANQIALCAPFIPTEEIPITGDLTPNPHPPISY